MTNAVYSSEQSLIPDKKLSLEKCRAILNKRGLAYTDDQIIQIRDFLYQTAEMSIRDYERRQESEVPIIPLKENDDYEQTESIPIHPGQYRRAS